MGDADGDNRVEAEQVKCPRCGALNAADAPYCLICGAVLGAAEQMAPLPPSPYAVSSSGGHPSAGPLAASAAPPAGPPTERAARRRGVSGPLVVVVLGVVGLCLLGALGLGVLGLAGAGGLPFLTPPTPTPEDPAAVLAEADAAMGKVTTLHYVMTATLPASVGGSQSQTLHLVGDVVRPDRYTMQTGDLGDLIVIGNDAYVRAGPGTPWVRRDAAAVGPGLAPTNPTVLLRFIHFARDPLAAPDVMSGTLRLHRINFPLDIQRMISEEGQESSGGALAGSRVTCDALIGAVDHRLYALDLDLVLPSSSAPTGASIEARFSNFNGPITIAPPADVQP